jgi:hypothetical protein
MMAKTTIGQKRLPVTKKKTRLNKRNNEEINDNPNNLNDNKKNQRKTLSMHLLLNKNQKHLTMTKMLQTA